MNRQIKFRVWSKRLCKFLNDKTFIDSDGNPYVFHQENGFTCGHNDEGDFCRLGTITTKQDCVVSMFTGLKDKNGREIYEGDILKFKTYDGWKDDFGRYVFLEVRYHELTASFRMTRGDIYRGDSFDYSDKPKEVEVAGDIFENPELLKAPAIDLEVRSIYLDGDGSIYCYDKEGKDVEYPSGWPERIDNITEFMNKQGIKIKR